MTKSGLTILTDQKRVPEQRWFDLTEDRRKRLKPQFDQFSLPTFESVPFLKMESGRRSLASQGVDAVVEGIHDLGLKSQGLFYWSGHAEYATPYSERCQLEHQLRETFVEGEHRSVVMRSGTTHLWGLSRQLNAAWVLATVSIDDESCHFRGDDHGRTRQYEKATKVVFTTSTLGEILQVAKITPKEICALLAQQANEWHESMRSRAKHMESIHQEMCAEDDLAKTLRL